MTCEERQYQILRRQSDELTATEQVALNQHMAACEACRSFSAELSRLTEAEASMPAPREVSELTLLRVRRRASRPRKQESFYRTWRPAILYGAAAIFLLLFTLRMTERQQMRSGPAQAALQDLISPELPAWNDDWEETMWELADQLSAIDAAITVENGLHESEEESLDDIAREMLEWEEWNI